MRKKLAACILLRPWTSTSNFRGKSIQNHTVGVFFFPLLSQLVSIQQSVLLSQGIFLACWTNLFCIFQMQSMLEAQHIFLKRTGKTEGLASFLRFQPKNMEGAADYPPNRHSLLEKIGRDNLTFWLHVQNYFHVWKSEGVELGVSPTRGVMFPHPVKKWL